MPATLSYVRSSLSRGAPYAILFQTTGVELRYPAIIHSGHPGRIPSSKAIPNSSRRGSCGQPRGIHRSRAIPHIRSSSSKVCLVHPGGISRSRAIPHSSSRSRGFSGLPNGLPQSSSRGFSSHPGGIPHSSSTNPPSEMKQQSSILGSQPKNNNSKGEDGKPPIPTFDFKGYMSSKVQAVNKALDSAVPLQFPEKIHSSMRYALLGGGKRICSIISIAACELFGGSEATVMPIACALEMMHDASIVHDDLPCMDDSALRRGRPTTHKAFGESTAVLTGDALICRAFELIAKETQGVSSERVLRVISHLGRTVGAEGMVAGQVVDLESFGDANTSLETLEFIHLHKTAVLCECAVVCGAIVGGGGEEDVEKLREYGRTLGLLFQVVDDLLDVEKTSEELGKPAGADELADKATYPKLLGLEATNLFAHELLKKAREQISGFDPVRAAPLIAIVEFVLNRPR